MKKLIEAIVVIAVILAILQAIVESPVASAICIVLIVAALVFFGLKIWKKIQAKKKQSEAVKEISPVEVAKPVAEVAMPVTVLTFDPNINHGFEYEYKDVGLYRPNGAVGKMPKIGQVVLLELDPENPYDNKAVKAVFCESDEIITVGYMNKGKLRNMVTDFINSDSLVNAVVTRADTKLEIWIGMDRYNDSNDDEEEFEEEVEEEVEEEAEEE